MLNNDQKDALREYIGLYIGQAASLLSEMIERRVHLMIPDIELVRSNIDAIETHRYFSFLDGYVVSSSIGFGTDFSGKAKLYFPKDKIKALVTLCIGEEADDIELDLTETDFDAIHEIGNIILNAIVGSMGNLVNVKLNYSIPEVNVVFFPEEAKRLFEENKTKNTHLLIIRNVFTVEEANVEGAIIVVLSMEAMNVLMEKIDQVLNDLM